MAILSDVIHEITKIITWTVFAISMYYLIISFFGIWIKKDEKKYEPKNKFALVVAAHNEEIVIRNIVHSLKELDYPKELYDIFVIADNCTDKTAERARKEGAIVYERFNKEKRGKGYALEWMFNKIFKMTNGYNAVVVFDADNLVHKNFLNEMNKRMIKGDKVIQGYLDSKNPEDTWITGSYSISFWTSNRMFQLSRSNLGLSNQLGGTGFCIDINVLKEIGWGATCLTEDLEFSCKLVLNGYKVSWAHEAVIYDEKPLTLKQSWAQRRRWMQGFADVSHRYFFKLIKKAVKDLDFKALDCALYSIQPIIILLFGFSMAMSTINYVNRALDMILNINEVLSMYIMNFNMVTFAAIIISVFQFIYTPFILILENKLDLKIFFYYIIYPIYAVTWIPISIQGILRKNDKEWSHTTHTRNVKINDLKKVN
ncbi:glycosyltransferase family 2 protein [Clostridium cochlearium]|uniref:glycosyltransferase family 2 protein n=1 Tax=Clostridium cochlearium TaxID=1494 RepID=UPI000B94781D|nr:glycosyltransferase family 2 protein [Clostridium cochlearium]SNV73884.1 N-acetylglucosaminyltransferase [Clostridium cochlearium]STA92242.1 N-acetylglucosaminyltransferase [Clostridium cochlearium]